MVKCDFCGNKAKFDGKTHMGPWANMCGHCVSEYGYPDNSGLCKVIKDLSNAVAHELSYEAWCQRLDEVLNDICGMSLDDLSDYNTADAHAEGLDPELVANDILMENDFF